jgi:hypothetical protein
VQPTGKNSQQCQWEEHSTSYNFHQRSLSHVIRSALEMSVTNLFSSIIKNLHGELVLPNNDEINDAFERFVIGVLGVVFDPGVIVVGVC